MLLRPRKIRISQGRGRLCKLPSVNYKVQISHAPHLVAHGTPSRPLHITGKAQHPGPAVVPIVHAREPRSCHTTLNARTSIVQLRASRPLHARTPLGLIGTQRRPPTELASALNVSGRRSFGAEYVRHTRVGDAPPRPAERSSTPRTPSRPSRHTS